MSELPPPGDYWLQTPLGGEKRAIVTTNNVLLIHQETYWSYGEYRGERWWQPHTIDEGWSFVPRVQ